MPSPIGHALAGVAVAWSVEQFPGFRQSLRPIAPRLTVISAALAAAPDLDLVYPLLHRTVTHSVAAVALTSIVVMVVTGWVTRAREGREGSARGPREDASRRAPGARASGGGAPRALKEVGQAGGVGVDRERAMN